MADRKGYSVEVYSARRTPTHRFGHSVEIVDIPTLREAEHAAGVAMRNMTLEGTLVDGDEVMIFREPERLQLFGAIVRYGEWQPYQVKEPRHAPLIAGARR